MFNLLQIQFSATKIEYTRSWLNAFRLVRVCASVLDSESLSLHRKEINVFRLREPVTFNLNRDSDKLIVKPNINISVFSIVSVHWLV